VIRVFTDPDVVHVDGKISPADDIETINTELVLADLQTLEKAFPRLEKETRKEQGSGPALLDRCPRRPRRCGTRGDAVLRRRRPRAAARADPCWTPSRFLYVFNAGRGGAGQRRS
jgi:hypothetical protein